MQSRVIKLPSMPRKTLQRQKKGDANFIYTTTIAYFETHFTRCKGFETGNAHVITRLSPPLFARLRTSSDMQLWMSQSKAAFAYLHPPFLEHHLSPTSDLNKRSTFAVIKKVLSNTHS